MKPRLKYYEAFGAYTVGLAVDGYELALSKRGRALSPDSISRHNIIRRADIGKIDATKLTLSHYSAFFDARRNNEVPTFLHRNKHSPLKTLKPATLNHDFTNLAAVLTWAHDYENVKVDLELLRKAKRILMSEGIIGKAEVRDRRPLADELERRKAKFIERGQHYMVLMDEWQVASCRRVGESCALLWTDWDAETHTILVRKMKDPKKKNKQKVVALTPEAEAILVRLAYERGPQDMEPRIFPYNKRTVSTASTEANKALGIVGLRLHDSRREGASRLAEKGHNSKEISMVTGHETTAILDRVYNKPDPRLFGKKLAEAHA